MVHGHRCNFPYDQQCRYSLTHINLSTHNHILAGDGNHIPVTGHGLCSINTKINPLPSVMSSSPPQIIKNLISVRKFTTESSCLVEFDPFGFFVKDLQTRRLITRCHSSGDLYPVTHDTLPSTCLATSLAAISSDTWHNRLGHPGNPFSLILGATILLIVIKIMTLVFANFFPIGKHNRLPFYSSSSTSNYAFDIIHADLWASPIRSNNGHKYYLVLLDDLTHYVWTIPLSFKSQVYQKFIDFQKYVLTQFERPIKTFQSDHGREFDNDPFKLFCIQQGMVFRFSCPYTSSQNGKAERMIHTINNSMRTILLHSFVPLSLWHHALETITYLLNILPSTVLHKKSPAETLFGRFPSYDHLRVFGCLFFPNLTATTPHKLAPRSTPCVFLLLRLSDQSSWV